MRSRNRETREHRQPDMKSFVPPKNIPLTEYLGMATRQHIWDVEYTDEFGAWWHTLPETEQIAVGASVRLLELFGPALNFPHSAAVNGSRHGHLRELRTQCGGRPLRTLYAFDPRRTAILLIGGDKTGNDRWYETHISKADALYDEHLRQLRKEGLLHG